MKIFLSLSLLFNIILGVLYFQEKNKSPIERIVIEQKPKEYHQRTNHSEEKPLKDAASTAEPKIQPDNKLNNRPDEFSDFEPISAIDEQSFRIAAEEMEQAKREFHEKKEISEEILKEKDEIVRSFWARYAEINQKYPNEMAMPFEDKKKLLKMEENLHKDLEKLYGKDKWQSYKSFVYSYNKKVDEARKRNGHDVGGLMMSYW